MPSMTMPRQLSDFAVLCTGCGSVIPLLLFVVSGRPHAQSRCPGCGQLAFLHRA